MWEGIVHEIPPLQPYANIQTNLTNARGPQILQHCTIVFPRYWDDLSAPEAKELVVNTFECHHLRLHLLDSVRMTCCHS